MIKNESDDTLFDAPRAEELAERPWIHLSNTHDIEAWINNYDWDLRRYAERTKATGIGSCFGLSHGGDLILQTTSEGEVLLDVTPDAQWVAPVITAATGIDVSESQIVQLPNEVLTQLIFGLSGLIATCKPVINHPFNIKKNKINW